MKVDVILCSSEIFPLKISLTLIVFLDQINRGFKKVA